MHSRGEDEGLIGDVKKLREEICSLFQEDGPR